jgi:hypothetical protein
MFDFIFEFVGEFIGEALLDGLCTITSGTVLGLADLNGPHVCLNLDEGRVTAADRGQGEVAVALHQPRRGGM